MTDNEILKNLFGSSGDLIIGTFRRRVHNIYYI